MFWMKPFLDESAFYQFNRMLDETVLGEKNAIAREKKEEDSSRAHETPKAGIRSVFVKASPA